MIPTRGECSSLEQGNTRQQWTENLAGCKYIWSTLRITYIFLTVFDYINYLYCDLETYWTILVHLNFTLGRLEQGSSWLQSVEVSSQQADFRSKLFNYLILISNSRWTGSFLIIHRKGSTIKMWKFKLRIQIIVFS